MYQTTLRPVIGARSGQDAYPLTSMAAASCHEGSTTGGRILARNVIPFRYQTDWLR